MSPKTMLIVVCAVACAGLAAFGACGPGQAGRL